MTISNTDRKFNLKYKKRFDYKTDIHGQNCILIKEIKGRRCPCYDERTGYGDFKWHLKNPEEPNCNESCYLDSKKKKKEIKAFIIPANSISDKKFQEIILAAVGKIKKDNYVYIGKSDTDIFSLNEETDYLLYHGHKWRILNPNIYKIGDIELSYMAILELFQEKI